jgi:D-tyrosyl-tRNA(Tyr) deacylase
VIAVLQRVAAASVRAEGQTVGRVSLGLVVLVGVERGDGPDDARALADKVAALRLFPGRTPTDRTVAEAGGGCLVVSQFTLAATVRKGNRPSFDRAEEPAAADALYLAVAARLREAGVAVETGRFGAAMQIDLTADGPVTILLAARGGRVLDVAPVAGA